MKGAEADKMLTGLIEDKVLVVHEFPNHKIFIQKILEIIIEKTAIIFLILEFRIQLNRKKYQKAMFDMIVDSQNDEQSEVLLPISSLFPPNEIINKHYSPDIKPNFRLMQLEKKERKKVTINSDNKMDSYSDKFGQNDTLGYQYAKHLKKSLVYLKFNNSSYMKFNIGGVNYRYLAGMFIPLQKLLSQQLKKNNNIYKILNHLDYIDNKHPIDTSFASNCYSEAPSLRFSSNYESSNLFAAFQINDSEYDLVLQNDINSKGNTQWFNFTIEINQQKTYKFNLVNLTKTSSLYQKGMRVVYYSQSNRIYKKQGWSRGCHNIKYEKTNVNRQDHSNLYYYKLHFQYKSEYKNDIVTFSYCYPYTTLNLQNFFNKITNRKNVNGLKVEKIKVSQTLSGIPIYVYSIIHKRNIASKNNIMSLQNLDGVSSNVSSVVFMARQHPGESQSSFIVEGIVEWLLENDADAWKKNFNFYVIPMVNADGVFYGNYRTNLTGNDLNRVWKQPRKDYHNEVYSLKKFLYALNKVSQISLIIDIHGHSNAINSFFYGNPHKKQAENPKFFPFYCSRKIKQISYSQSTFAITQDKKCCARVVLSEMFPKALVYTFETSFYGWKKGKSIIQHTIQSYKRLGKQLVQCFIQFTRLIDKNPSIKQKWSKQIQQQIKDIKGQEEEIVTESDEEIQNQLIEFRQLFQEQTDTSLYKELNSKSNVKKKLSSVSIGKRRLHRMFRRHSPVSKNKNYTTFNDNYIMDKHAQTISESQGFLSIVKINTKSYIDSTPFQNQKSLELKKQFQKDFEQKERQNKAEENSIFNNQAKQNMSQKYIKVGKLLNEKELTLEKIKEKRLKIQQQIGNKHFNGFFKNIYYKK